MDPGVNTFGVIQIGMTTADHVTDGVQANEYFKSKDYRWASLTFALMFLPMATSCMTEIMNNTIKYCRGRSDLVSWKQSLKRIASHFPLIQPIVHTWYFLQLRKNKGIMLKARKFYQSFKPEDIKNDNLLHHQVQVNKAAEDYTKARKAFSSLKTEFQEMKLYEAFGEACPQAILQVSIIMQVGYITPLQCFTIATSVFSFSRNSSSIFLLMKTKRKDIKEASWKEMIIVFPTMFCIVIPRILSLSIIAAYKKDFFPIVLVTMVIANTVVNLAHFKRDPGQAFLGVMTNIFAPCIIVEEGSGFFRRSGITSSILHILAQVSLFCLVYFNILVPPCPYVDGDQRIYVPISHCFSNRTVEPEDTSSSMARCLMDYPYEELNKTTHEVVIPHDIPDIPDKLMKTYGMIPILWNEKPRFPCCFGIPWWRPLLNSCLSYIFCHIIGILLISKVLDPIIDPIVMFKASKSCFPLNMCDPIWNEENVDFLQKDTVESFLKYPCQCLLKPDNLFQVSIENDFHEIVNIALNKMENPIKIDKKLVDEAYLRGSVKTIKMILRKINELDDEANFDLEVLKKTLQGLRMQPKGFNKAVFSIKEPVFSLQKYCGLSPIQQRQHWRALQLPITNLLRVRINCSVVGHGMMNGEIFLILLFFLNKTCFYKFSSNSKIA